MSAAVKTPEPRDDDSLRVLVVEDRPDSVLLLTRVLELSGCVVQTKRNGTEALTVANSFTPDAALIDIGLPGLDGLHVARELRKQDLKTLLVAITGRSAPNDILNSKAAGFDHHLTKPLDCGKLTEIKTSTGRCRRPNRSALQSNRHMILHIDMDAFYASVEERDDPSLVGKPVIVGGSADSRGVVAAANYEVRKFGVHSAMAAARAKRLCPHAVFLTPRIEYYASVSRQIREIFEQFTPLVEPLSLDEAFLDVTGSESIFGSAASIGRQIKQRIRSELKLVASVGVAPNKFVAKIASDVNKPDGFVVVEADEVQAFLDPLPVGRLWGVGKVTGQVFEQMSIHTIGQLRQMPVEELNDRFGSSGEHYWKLAHGIDDRRVVPDREAKSISAETTFAEDISDMELLRAWLVDLVEQVARRLRRHDIKGRTIELKVRFADFKTITRSLTLTEPTNITQELLEAGIELLTKRLPPRHLAVRLLGFGVNKLDDSTGSQQQLFDQPDRAKNREVDRVADQITAKFGKLAIQRGARLDKGDGGD